MGQSIRERIPELAVLKTIGFTNRAVLLLVLAEAVLLLLIGGLLGMGMARLSLPAIREATSGQFDLTMQTETWILAVGLMTVIGIAVGLPPALKAMRLSIVDALAGR
jgi:putative ABC transport system permease protein